MGIVIPNSRREHSRYALTGHFEGAWSASDHSSIEVLPIDLSVKGLGLLINPPLPRLEEIHWDLASQKIKLSFRILWTLEPSADHDFSEILNMRRCGLELLTTGYNLVDICTQMKTLQILD